MIVVLIPSVVNTDRAWGLSDLFGVSFMGNQDNNQLQVINFPAYQYP
jgi:hypothetical protein